MNFFEIPADLVEAIHDEVLNPGELPGRAADRPLESALARVENRLAYGLIADVFDLAAAYAVAIARGHCFHDGNKRTAFRTMQTCLDLYGFVEPEGIDSTGDIIIRVARGDMDEGDLADWLRALSRPTGD